MQSCYSHYSSQRAKQITYDKMPHCSGNHRRRQRSKGLWKRRMNAPFAKTSSQSCKTPSQKTKSYYGKRNCKGLKRWREMHVTDFTIQGRRECLDIVDNPIDMMNHLYDLRPSTCEYMGHCKRCIPCTPPAECVICEPPDATDLGWMDLMSTSWKSFSEWFSVPYTHKKGYIWDNMNQGI